MVNLLYLTKNENQSFVAFIPIGNMTEVHNVLRNKGRWRTGAEGGKGVGKWKGVWGGGTRSDLTLTASQQQPRALEGTAEGQMGTVRGREKGCWRKQAAVKGNTDQVLPCELCRSRDERGCRGQDEPGRLMQSKAGREVDKSPQIQNIAVWKELTGCQ